MAGIDVSVSICWRHCQSKARGSRAWLRQTSRLLHPLMVEGDLWLRYTTWSLLAAERPGSRPESTLRETVARRSYLSAWRPVDKCSTASISRITQGFPTEWRDIRWVPCCSNRRCNLD